MLTKGPTQQQVRSHLSLIPFLRRPELMSVIWWKQILADTGAAVLTKGVWYPDKSMATDKDPALYLHISAVRSLSPFQSPLESGTD